MGSSKEKLSSESPTMNDVSSGQSVESISLPSGTQVTPASMTSPPLRLAAELRNRIYIEATRGLVSSPGHETPGLLVACRHTRAECIDLFHASATFKAHKRHSLRLVEPMPEKRRALITEIRCDLSLYERPIRPRRMVCCFGSGDRNHSTTE
jgi:hypothetical protein